MSEAYANGVVLSAQFSMPESSHSQKISIEFLLKSNGPRIEPCGTPYSIFNLSLKYFFLFVGLALKGLIMVKVWHQSKSNKMIYQFVGSGILSQSDDYIVESSVFRKFPRLRNLNFDKILRILSTGIIKRNCFSSFLKYLFNSFEKRELILAKFRGLVPINLLGFVLLEFFIYDFDKKFLPLEFRSHP